MPRRTVILTLSAVAAALGCQRPAESDVKPLAPVAPGDGQMIDVSEISGSVLGVNDAHTKCPVRPHVEAAIVARGVTGVIQYRWERSGSTPGPLLQLTLPPAGADGLARAKLVPDEWRDTTRGTPVSVTDQVNISYPFAVSSPPATVTATCF